MLATSHYPKVPDSSNFYRVDVATLTQAWFDFHLGESTRNSEATRRCQHTESLQSVTQFSMLSQQMRTGSLKDSHRSAAIKPWSDGKNH